MDVSKLEGAALAEAVARALGWMVYRDGEHEGAEMVCQTEDGETRSFGEYGFRPDLEWEHGGPDHRAREDRARAVAVSGRVGRVGRRRGRRMPCERARGRRPHPPWSLLCVRSSRASSRRRRPISGAWKTASACSLRIRTCKR